MMMKNPSSRLSASDWPSRYMTSGHSQVAPTRTVRVANRRQLAGVGRWDCRKKAATARPNVTRPPAAAATITALVGGGSLHVGPLTGRRPDRPARWTAASSTPSRSRRCRSRRSRSRRSRSRKSRSTRSRSRRSRSRKSRSTKSRSRTSRSRRSRSRTSRSTKCRSRRCRSRRCRSRKSRSTRSRSRPMPFQEVPFQRGAGPGVCRETGNPGSVGSSGVGLAQADICRPCAAQ